MVKKEKKQVYLRWGILAVIILLVSLLQNTGGLLPRIYSVSAMPLIPLVVCIAMLEREMAGACFGMFAGMLLGCRGHAWRWIPRRCSAHHRLHLRVVAALPDAGQFCHGTAPVHMRGVGAQPALLAGFSGDSGL